MGDNFFLIKCLIGPVEWWNYSWHSFLQVFTFTSQVFLLRQIVSSSMFSPHTCLFSEDTRAGLDIQRRSEENFHLYTVLLLLKIEEEKKKHHRIPSKWGLHLGQQRSNFQTWGALCVQPGRSGQCSWSCCARNLPGSWGTHRPKSKTARRDSELSTVTWDCQGHSSGWHT